MLHIVLASTAIPSLPKAKRHFSATSDRTETSRLPQTSTSVRSRQNVVDGLGEGTSMFPGGSFAGTHIDSTLAHVVRMEGSHRVTTVCNRPLVALEQSA